MGVYKNLHHYGLTEIESQPFGCKKARMQWIEDYNNGIKRPLLKDSRKWLKDVKRAINNGLNMAIEQDDNKDWFKRQRKKLEQVNELLEIK